MQQLADRRLEVFAINQIFIPLKLDTTCSKPSPTAPTLWPAEAWTGN